MRSKSRLYEKITQGDQLIAQMAAKIDSHTYGRHLDDNSLSDIECESVDVLEREQSITVKLKRQPRLRLLVILLIRRLLPLVACPDVRIGTIGKRHRDHVILLRLCNRIAHLMHGGQENERDK